VVEKPKTNFQRRGLVPCIGASYNPGPQKSNLTHQEQPINPTTIVSREFDQIPDWTNLNSSPRIGQLANVGSDQTPALIKLPTYNGTGTGYVALNQLPFTCSRLPSDHGTTLESTLVMMIGKTTTSAAEG
jgi:hypothetical protein